MRLAKLPGDTLYEIADLLFGATPYMQSLSALIADAQREWSATSSRLGRARVRSRLLTAFWQSVLLHAVHRATRPPGARAAMSIALTVVLLGTSAGGTFLWLHDDWPVVIEKIVFLMPLWVSIPLSSPGHTFVALIPERERWRTFHQFSVLWVLLAVLWMGVAGASAWLPIATAASALVSRGIAVWLQHRRERRAVRA